MTARVERQYVPGRWGQMHLRRAGGGGAHCPLVCIHMSPMSGRVFERFLDAMGADRLAVAFDTPGFGMSDTPSAPPRIEDYAEDLRSGLAALGIAGAFDLMGYHTGSMIAVALARQAPDRVRRVIMVSAPVFPEDERRQFRQYYAHRAPQADGSHLLKRWQGFLYHHLRPGTTIEAVADAFRDALLGGNLEWWGHRAAFEYDLAAGLAGAAPHILILNPGDDLDLQTRRAQGLAPHSHLLEVPGWGHGFLDAHTAEAAALARSFLDAPDDRPFAGVTVPPSAAGPRYPQRVGSFPPGAGTSG